jgi:hypothetical protein
MIMSVDIITLIALLLFGLYIILVPLRLIVNSYYWSGFLVLAITLTTITVFYFEQPLNYIILYFVALSYHFISWSFHFLQQFIKNSPERVKKYLWHHVYVLAPFVGVTFLLLYNIPYMREIHWWLFDGKLFLILAMVHNTTSLLNEEWFESWLNKKTI